MKNKFMYNKFIKFLGGKNENFTNNWLSKT